MSKLADEIERLAGEGMTERLQSLGFIECLMGPTDWELQNLMFRNIPTILAHLRAPGEPAGEPVAWFRVERRYNEYDGSAREDAVGYLFTNLSDRPQSQPGWAPLYARPPARAWVDVKERLPANRLDLDVLVWGQLQEQQFMTAWSACAAGFADASWIKKYGITHWCDFFPPTPTAQGQGGEG